MIYFDTETCGFTGPMVLLQYAVDDGPIVLHEIFNEDMQVTVELIEWMCTQDICAFNLVFDWFHLVKIYNILRELLDMGYTGTPPVEAMIQVEATNPSRYCLKPKGALDLMLVGRRGEFQYAMSRKPVNIRRVPYEIAEPLAKYLKENIQIPDICFAKSSSGYRWRIKDTDDPKLVDLVLDFHPSTGLDAMAEAMLGVKKAKWPIPKNYRPTEAKWKPYGQIGDRPWGKVIYKHIAMWQFNKQARFYADRDVELTRRLRLEGFPDAPINDTDSVLAVAVGAARWRGFEVDTEQARQLLPGLEEQSKIGPTAPKAAMEYLETLMDPLEKATTKSTNKVTLQHLVEHGSSEELKARASNVLAARQAKSRHTLITKLSSTPKLHPNLNIIGTKTNRQSGGDTDEGTSEGSINPQGIPRDPVIRSCFPMCDRETEELWGGDAVAYEITIIDAVLPDPVLHEELLSGKKFHALMGAIWFDTDYESMMYEKEKGEKGNKYDASKGADFAWFYGAEVPKISSVLGQEEDETKGSYDKMASKYKEMVRQREEIALSFCSMRQPGGLGTKVEWHEPADYVESIFGFRRYFTIENHICRKLFEAANSGFKDVPGLEGADNKKILRRDDRGLQTLKGAACSAFYAAAFGLQAANMRAACNHIIQSPGGEITKEFQRELWEHQPIGVSEWIIRLYNMHDEILSAVKKGAVNTTEIRDRVISKYKKHIPLLDWEWDKLESWGDK